MYFLRYYQAYYELLQIETDDQKWWQSNITPDYTKDIPGIMPGSITFENILSIRVLEWLVILVINELEARESKNSFV